MCNGNGLRYMKGRKTVLILAQHEGRVEKGLNNLVSNRRLRGLISLMNHLSFTLHTYCPIDILSLWWWNMKLAIVVSHYHTANWSTSTSAHLAPPQSWLRPPPRQEVIGTLGRGCMWCWRDCGRGRLKDASTVPPWENSGVPWRYTKVSRRQKTQA